LGLLDPHRDLHDPERPALAANPLAAGRVQPLSLSEQAALAVASTGPLFTAWGGTAPRTRRDSALDLQLAQLALLGDAPAIVAACAPGAVAALRSGPAADAFQLGQDAIHLLDRHGRAVPLNLLRQTANAALSSGDGEKGEALLNRAVQQAEAGDEQGIDPLDQARVIAERARHLITRGEPEQAEQLLRHAHQLLAAGGSELEAAAAMGSIADIAYQRGDYDEALRIRREVQLPVYERLGETRSTAITWGNIADIAYQRGDYDKAVKLYRKRLEAYKELSDLEGIAAADWDLASIDLKREDYESALPRLMESFQILSSRQRPDGVAIVGWTLGQLLMAAGRTDFARQVLADSLAAATKMDWTDLVQQIGELLEATAAVNEET
jgi:tetratricopeptide (TPR) repeat protein